MENMTWSRAIIVPTVEKIKENVVMQFIAIRTDGMMTMIYLVATHLARLIVLILGRNVLWVKETAFPVWSVLVLPVSYPEITRKHMGRHR